MFCLSIGVRPPDLCGSDVGNLAAEVVVSPNETAPRECLNLRSIERRKTIVRFRLPHIRTRSEYISLPFNTQLCYVPDQEFL